jgi:tetratricopeptide (TPR) repeat protein
VSAEADLSRLLRPRPTPSPGYHGPDLALQALSLRAEARLALGRPADAEADAARAYRREASPAHERLWRRALLAMGRDRDLRVDDPDEIRHWPAGGLALINDLRASSERLGIVAAGGGDGAVSALLTRAVLLSALDDPEATSEASRALARASMSAHAYLVRARILRRAGDPLGAWADVERGLSLEPDDPRLLELRGMLQSESGRPAAALADFDRAIRRGAEGTVRRPRAQALVALGRLEPSLEDWSRALLHDPEDPLAYLGRARVFLRLRQGDKSLADLDQAFADLEQAAGWAADRLDVLLPLTVAYASCLRDRPDRVPRVMTLARRACMAIASHNMLRSQPRSNPKQSAKSGLRSSAIPDHRDMVVSLPNDPAARDPKPLLQRTLLKANGR